MPPHFKISALQRFSFLACLLSSFILHSSSFSQTSGQSVIDKKNSGTGFTREAFSLGNSQILGRTSSGSLSGLTLGTGLTLTGTTITAASSSGAWADITGKPATFAPSAHDQEISTITGLQDALDGKAATVEPSFETSVTISDVNNPVAPGTELNGIIIRSNREGLSQTEQQIIFGNGAKTGRLYAPILSNDYLWLLPQASGRVMLDSDNSGGIAATRLTSATVPTARLGSGTASASTFLRGDGTWAAVSGLALTGGTLTGAVDSNINALATSPLPSFNLVNSTAALVGAQVQVSPALIFEGQAWKTNATAGSQSVRFRQSVLPIVGAAAPSGMMLFQSDINGANAWTTRLGIGFASTANGLYTEVGGGIFFAGVSSGNQNNVGISGSGIAQLNLHANASITHSIVNNSGQGFMQAFNAGGFAWSGTGTAGGTADVVLRREAANHLAQRNGTTSQRLSVANTYTSTTNNELGVMDWQTTTNTLRLGSSKGSGGGSNRAVDFIMGDTVEMRFDTDGNVILPLLPTTAPATSGALWRDAANGNVLKVVP